MTIGDVLHKLVQNVRWFAQSEEEAAHNEIDKFIHAFGLEPATPTGVPTELTVEQDQANQIAELQARLSAQAAPENDVPVDTRAAAAPETVVEATPETVVEATPETVVEATPETVVEATPETVVEATPETVVEATPANDVPVDTRAAAAPETVVDDKAQKIADLEAQLASLKS